MLFLLKGELKAVTPFMIGNGKDENSDRDVIRTSQRELFIPGTSIAGICRHFLSSLGESGDDINRLFGGKLSKENKSEDKRETLESRIIFYDAFECSAENDKAVSEERGSKERGAGITSVRDSVRLNHKVSVPQSKFDYEIVEAGARFHFRVELTTDERNEGCVEQSENRDLIDAWQIFRKLIHGFNRGDIRVGGKTTRGFGIFEAENLKYLSLDLRNKDDMDRYLELDAEWGGEDWKEYSPDEDNTKELYERLERSFSLDGFLFIRDYASLAKVSEERDSKFVDAQTLTDAEGNPIIPGTSWAGAFRHHCGKILRKAKYQEGDFQKIKELLDDLFGYETELDESGNLIKEKTKDSKKKKSNILFRESRIERDEVVMLNRTRNAVDRFSGSSLQTGALFTERIACKKDGDENNTEIKLEVKIRKNITHFDLAKNLISLCLQDLESGILAIGGNTSIGAGVFCARGKGEGENE